MKMTITKLNDWIRKLAETKPYRIMVKNGIGFYEVLFLYGDYHYTDRLYMQDMDDELNCQKKVLAMCSTFEHNFKLRTFQPMERKIEYYQEEGFVD